MTLEGVWNVFFVNVQLQNHMYFTKPGKVRKSTNTSDGIQIRFFYMYVDT